MNGDLSLSRALGGLRIANPDDASSPSPGRELTAGPDRPDSPPAQPSTSMALPNAPLPEQGVPTKTSDGSPHTAQHHTYEAAAAILEQAQHNLQIAQRNRSPSNPADPHVQQMQLSPPRTGPPGAATRRSPAPRPTSDVYPRDADQPAGHLAPFRSDSARVSSYGASGRGDSRGGMPPASTGPSRESSRSYHNQGRQGPLPPGGGPAPPRRSSKGMGGGYASVPSVSQAPSSSAGYGADGPVPASSEEWKDRGAALGVRKEVDQDGRTVLKSVKKGVRDFSFGRILGEGSYSTVYFATDRQTLREYAVKVLEKKHIIKEKKIKYVNIEKNTLNRLTEHPGIVRLYYTFQDEASLYYVLDLCNGGELLAVLKKTGTFDEECTRFYGAQILDAVGYMHSRGVIHRDLKPENVLMDDKMHIKITDFGTAKLLDDPRAPKQPEGVNRTPDALSGEQKAASFVGTAEYVSPELLMDKTAGKPSDIWAFGCVIYQLLAGRPPFKGGSEYLTFQKIVNLDYQFPDGFPPAARDLVERCLVLDPTRRLTIDHIRNHEFFDGQKFGKELWRMQAPRLRPYVPPPQEPHVISLNGNASSSSIPMSVSTPRGPAALQANGSSSRPARIITELPPPTQLDIEWSPVLTRNNERILKLGDLMVISSPLPNSPHGKGEHGDGHKKLSRFFGGSTTKKRQRLVMITSSGRIVLAPAGGDDKRAKQEISLLAPDCAWRSQVDVKGQLVWCVDTGGIHYSFEEPKSSSTNDASNGGKYSVDDWVESLERAKDLALAQDVSGGYFSVENGFGDLASGMSSPASTIGGRSAYQDAEGLGGGFGVASNDRSSGRNQLSKSQASLPDEISSAKRNRFSKRQSKTGLGAAF